MPIIQPGRADVHVNRPLTSISIAYMLNTDDFVAGKTFPVVPVDKQSDLYYVVDAEREMLRDIMQERAPATESDGMTFKLSTNPYFARKYSLHHDIPDEVRDNADDPLDMDQMTTQALTQSALIRREVLFNTSFFTAGNPGDTWTFDVDGVSSGASTAAAFDPTDNANNQKLQWNDAASTPIEDIRQGKRYVKARTGLRPNVLTLQETVYDTLLDHPDIVGRIDRGQTSGAAMANRVTLAQLFEVDEVLVMGGVKNSAQKGATASIGFIGGKNALLSYRPPAPGRMVASAGYWFDWKNGRARGIRKFRMELKDADRLEYTDYMAPTKIGADLGYFFGAIVA